MNDQLSEPLLKAVRLADVRAYLISRGWEVKPFKRQQVLRFEGPPDDEGNPIVQLIPASEYFLDFPMRVEELVRTLSVIEGRPAAHILRNIVSPTCDVVEVRLESPDTAGGTLPAGFARQFMSSLYDFFVFSACGYLDPRRYFPRALKQATNYADHCRIRLAPARSFVVEVESPVVPPANEEQVRLRDYPLERRFVSGMMRGLDELHRAVNLGDRTPLAGAQEAQVNANVCESLLSMREEAPSARLEISVAWSPFWPVEGVPQGQVAFEGKAFEQIAAIGRALRGIGEPQPRDVRGRVVKLFADNPAQDSSGRLVVTLLAEQGAASRHVEAPLSRDDYLRAVQAHVEGRDVAIQGELVRSRRKWQLLHAQNLRVLPADPELPFSG